MKMLWVRHQFMFSSSYSSWSASPSYSHSASWSPLLLWPLWFSKSFLSPSLLSCPLLWAIVDLCLFPFPFLTQWVWMGTLIYFFAQGIVLLWDKFMTPKMTSLAMERFSSGALQVTDIFVLFCFEKWSLEMPLNFCTSLKQLLHFSQSGVASTISPGGFISQIRDRSLWTSESVRS